MPCGSGSRRPPRPSRARSLGELELPGGEQADRLRAGADAPPRGGARASVSSVVIVVNRHRGSAGRSGPESTPVVDEVHGHARDPDAVVEGLRIGVEARERGSSEGWMLIAGKRARKPGVRMPIQPAQHHELDVVGARASRPGAASRSSRPRGTTSCGDAGRGRALQRRARRPRRSRRRRPARAAPASKVSSSACRLLPVPETSTPTPQRIGGRRDAQHGATRIGRRRPGRPRRSPMPASPSGPAVAIAAVASPRRDDDQVADAAVEHAPQLVAATPAGRRGA